MQDDPASRLYLTRSAPDKVTRLGYWQANKKGAIIQPTKEAQCSPLGDMFLQGLTAAQADLELTLSPRQAMDFTASLLPQPLSNSRSQCPLCLLPSGYRSDVTSQPQGSQL